MPRPSASPPTQLIQLATHTGMFKGGEIGQVDNYFCFVTHLRVQPVGASYVQTSQRNWIGSRSYFSEQSTISPQGPWATGATSRSARPRDREARLLATSLRWTGRRGSSSGSGSAARRRRPPVSWLGDPTLWYSVLHPCAPPALGAVLYYAPHVERGAQIRGRSAQMCG